MQCDITGRWLPESETIVLDGFRVGAEGKAELLERLRTGRAMPGQVDRPSLLRRFACTLVDYVIMWVLLNVSMAALAAVLVGSEWFVFLAVLVMMAYVGFMHGAFGRTLGKMLGRTRVVKLDSSPIDMQTAMLRMLYLLAPIPLGTLVFIIGTKMINPVLIFVGVSIISLGGFYALVSAIVAALDGEKQRAIHDLLAGTRVIHIE